MSGKHEETLIVSEVFSQVGVLPGGMNRYDFADRFITPLKNCGWGLYGPPAEGCVTPDQRRLAMTEVSAAFRFVSQKGRPPEVSAAVADRLLEVGFVPGRLKPPQAT